MGEVEALQIAHRQFAEDVVRMEVAYLIRSLPCTGPDSSNRVSEGVDIFLEWHAILQTERDDRGLSSDRSAAPSLCNR